MDGLHLTLRYLGPTLDDRLPLLGSVLEAAALGYEPFEVAIGAGGAFPALARPRVLWLDVEEGGETLARLAGSIDERLAAEGWPHPEHGFKPHLTLARADGVPSGSSTASALIAAADGFRRTWTADRIALFESHTGGGPARYEALGEARLGA